LKAAIDYNDPYQQVHTDHNYQDNEAVHDGFLEKILKTKKKIKTRQF
jgi:hypothetical protein